MTVSTQPANPPFAGHPGPVLAVAVTPDGTEGHRPRRAATWSAMAVRAVAQREMGERTSAVPLS